MNYLIKTLTQKGHTHESNEDAFVVGEGYIAVADGMGGELGGEIASKLALKAISKILEARLANAKSENEIRNISMEAISKADSRILSYVQDNPDSEGMGTTVVLLVLKGTKCFVSWCGDSRCYKYSGEGLKVITKDHSYVQELIDKKTISVEASFYHPANNIITRYVGGGKDVCRPEFVSFELNRTEIVFLCSDGFSGYCNDKEIEIEISTSKPEQLHLRFLDLALKNGSEDDITVITVIPNKRHHSILDWFKSVRFSHNPNP